MTARRANGGSERGGRRRHRPRPCPLAADRPGRRPPPPRPVTLNKAADWRGGRSARQSPRPPRPAPAPPGSPCTAARDPPAAGPVTGRSAPAPGRGCAAAPRAAGAAVSKRNLRGSRSDSHARFREGCRQEALFFPVRWYSARPGPAQRPRAGTPVPLRGHGPSAAGPAGTRLRGAARKALGRWHGSAVRPAIARARAARSRDAPPAAPGSRGAGAAEKPSESRWPGRNGTSNVLCAWPRFVPSLSEPDEPGRCRLLQRSSA